MISLSLLKVKPLNVESTQESEHGPGEVLAVHMNYQNPEYIKNSYKKQLKKKKDVRPS